MAQTHILQVYERTKKPAKTSPKAEKRHNTYFLCRGVKCLDSIYCCRNSSLANNSSCDCKDKRGINTNWVVDSKGNIMETTVYEKNQIVYYRLWERNNFRNL